MAKQESMQGHRHDQHLQMVERVKSVVHEWVLGKRCGHHFDLPFMWDCHCLGFRRGAAAFIQTERKPRQRRIGAFALAGDECC